jgi:hypothetical protein
MKLQMLESNIVRVISQNKRLQHLLDYRDFFPRLREHSGQVSSNWGRLNALIADINGLDLEIKTDRETIHSSVNHYYEHINRHIIQQIKDHRATLGRHQERIAEVKNGQRVRVRKHLDKLRAKWGKHIRNAESQMMDIILNAENSFVEQIAKEVVPCLAARVHQEF